MVGVCFDGTANGILRMRGEGQKISHSPETLTFMASLKVYVAEGHYGDEHVYQFVADLNQGTIAIVGNKSLPKEASIFRGLGHIGTCDESKSPISVSSPDGKYSVTCKAMTSSSVKEEVDYLVFSEGGKEFPTVQRFSSGRIAGISWSPNSMQIAILLDEVRFDPNPIVLFSRFFLGHSGSIERFKLQLLDVGQRRLLNLPTIRDYSENGIASVEWIAD